MNGRPDQTAKPLSERLAEAPSANTPWMRERVRLTKAVEDARRVGDRAAIAKARAAALAHYESSIDDE